MKIWQFFVPHLWRGALFSFVRRVVVIPAGLLTAELTSRTADAAVSGDIDGVWSVGGLLISVAVCTQLLTAVSDTAANRAAATGRNSVQQTFYRLFLERPLSVLAQEKRGDAKEKFNDDLNRVCDACTGLIPGIAAALLSALIYIAYLTVRAPVLALLYCGMAALQILPPIVVKKYFQRYYVDSREIEGRLTDYIVSGYKGFADIRLYDAKDRWFAGLKRLHSAYIRIGNRTELASGAENAVESTISTLLKYGAYGVAGAYVLRRGVSVSEAVAAAALAGTFFAAVNELFAKIPELAVTRTAFGRLNPWLTPEKERFSNRTALEHVSFGRVLRDVTVCIAPDTTTAVTGINGAGKTTLLRLLAGLLKPDSGEAFVLRPEQIAYLPQTDALFGIPGADLLAMAGEKAAAIARRFGLSEAQLAADVRELSGGERKKVFLAVVFAAAPRLLILDEPANSLDTAGIAVLRELIAERTGTTLYVSHGDALEGCAQYELRVENGEVHTA